MAPGFLQLVLASSVALLALVALMLAVYLAYSAIRARWQKAYFEGIHRELREGQRVVFAGGLYGTVARVGNETCDVRTKSGELIEVSRFAIQKIASGSKAQRPGK